LQLTLLPVGELQKADVRAIADELGLPTATKPDSQDVCFITSTVGRSGFLRERVAFTSGQVVDRRGRAIGRVPAVELVTIGQRKGLGLQGGDAAPRYAISVDVDSATVVVGDERDLYGAVTELRDLTFPQDVVAEVHAQCSAHGPALAARFEPTQKIVVWNEPHRRVAPGQAVVLYDGDEVVGGGIAVSRSRARAPR
jgi:tRNA-specific 2-thiouridylase